MKNSIKLTVTNIIGESSNGYSRVTVNYNVFNAIIQSLNIFFAKMNGEDITNLLGDTSEENVLTFVGEKDSEGKFTNTFTFDGVKVHQAKVGKNNVFFMKTEDAEALLVESTTVKLPFSISKLAVA